jgi:hypothetical protein
MARDTAIFTANMMAAPQDISGYIPATGSHNNIRPMTGVG